MFVIIYSLFFSALIIIYIISIVVYRIKHRRFLEKLLETFIKNNLQLKEILQENIQLWEVFTSRLKEHIQKDSLIDDKYKFSHKDTISNIVKDILNKDDWPQKVNIGFIDKLVSTITAKYDEYEEEYEIRDSIYKKTKYDFKKLYSQSNIA